MKKIKNRFIPTRSKEITLGFVPLIDCAPLVVAKELGMFEKRGLKIALQREFGWAAIRDKLLFGELDAAHAAAGLSLSMTLGVGSIAMPMLTGLVLNSNGNSIVMNLDLANRLEESGRAFAKRVQSLQGKKKITLGVVSLTSSHYFLLGEWLAKRGVDIQKDVNVVVLPPPQMTQNMATGNIQGFCAGEPWGSVAVEEGLGECVAVSAEVRPNHIEKVLLVQAGFEENCAEEHAKIREALLEACQYCDQIENRSSIAEMISPACYVKCSPSLILRSLRGPYKFGNGTSRTISGFHQFFGESCNAPTVEKAEWLIGEFEHYGLVQGMIVNRFELLRSVFREDLYRQSVGVVRSASSGANSTTSPSASVVHGVNYQWA